VRTWNLGYIPKTSKKEKDREREMREKQNI
jgi:hypothetical protein